MSYLRLERLEKRFGETPAADGFELEVAQNETLALLGPSGSGKTTVLRLVAGFETPDSGRILVAGEDVTRVPPEKRRFGMVFQHYALFPHMSVAENVAFGLESSGVPRAARARRVAETLAAVDLSGFEERSVAQLSGGQQQRVALARAVAPEPRILLLDEPLSNLDPTLRERTRRELKRIIGRLGITTLFVTHEQEEAFDLGDRVAVINGGRLEQVGAPEALYDEPATRFVATFIGRSTVLPAAWVARERAARLPTGQAWPAVAAEELADGAAVDLVVRPESAELAASGGDGAVPGEVVARRFGGRTAFYEVSLAGELSLEVLGAPTDASPGAKVSVRPTRDGPLPRAYRRSG